MKVVIVKESVLSLYMKMFLIDDPFWKEILFKEACFVSVYEDVSN